MFSNCCRRSGQATAGVVECRSFSLCWCRFKTVGPMAASAIIFAFGIRFAQHLPMPQQRWLRIIPVALIMYTISYVDRTNVSLALDPNISTMMRDLLMDDRMKGRAAGIFFIGYILLQAVGGHLAGRWSAKKLVSL